MACSHRAVVGGSAFLVFCGFSSSFRCYCRFRRFVIMIDANVGCCRDSQELALGRRNSEAARVDGMGAPPGCATATNNGCANVMPPPLLDGDEEEEPKGCVATVACHYMRRVVVGGGRYAPVFLFIIIIFVFWGFFSACVELSVVS